MNDPWMDEPPSTVSEAAFGTGNEFALWVLIKGAALGTWFGFLAGLTAGTIVGTAAFPPLGTLYGAVVGAVLGPALGFPLGLLVAGIAAAAPGKAARWNWTTYVIIALSACGPILGAILTIAGVWPIWSVGYILLLGIPQVSFALWANRRVIDTIYGADSAERMPTTGYRSVSYVRATFASILSTGIFALAVYGGLI